MSETTPGPWRARKAPTGAWTVSSVYRGFQDMRTTAFIAICDCQGQPNETNARMMAAAPALYATLQLAAECIKGEIDAWEYTLSSEEFRLNAPRCRDVMKVVLAALADADGRDAEAKP